MTELDSTLPAGAGKALFGRRRAALPCITSRHRIRLLATAAFAVGFAAAGHADQVVQGPDPVVIPDEWIFNDTLVVGQDQDGELDINSGGNVQSNGDVILGENAGVVGTVVVT